MFFSYVPEEGFELHSTEDGARDRAGKFLDAARLDAVTEGWPEDVIEICWGELRERVQEIGRRQATEEDCLPDDFDSDEVVAYALLPEESEGIMTCTRCCGTGFLNIHQLPDCLLDREREVVLAWISDHQPDTDVRVCDCCGDGADWYGEPGRHYTAQDPAGKNGPYAANGGLCRCH